MQRKWHNLRLAAGHLTLLWLASLIANPLWSGAALANSDLVEQSDDDVAITVTGAVLNAQSRQEELAQFVRQIGVAIGDQPAARWIDFVCPRVVGLAHAYTPIVESAIRRMALKAAAPVAKTGCSPNLIVAFTNDASDLVGKVAAKSPGQLAQVPLPERGELKHGTAPVRWWYSTGERSKDGVRSNAVPPPWTSGNSESGNSVLPMNVDTTTINQTGSSIISTQVVRALTSAVVVVDVNRAGGVRLDALADYVGLVGLAEVRRSNSPPAESILQLFEPGALVTAITQRDAAFLQALYKLPLDRRARQQRGLLVEALLEAEGGKP